MKIALALTNAKKLYHNNPWTAPLFAIYSVDEQARPITYSQIDEISNPWLKKDESVICDTMACSAGCSMSISDDLNHLSDHYILLEAVHGCDHMIVDNYCINVEKVLTNAGIALFEVSSFIHEPDAAIKKLLISKNIIYNVNEVQTNR